MRSAAGQPLRPNLSKSPHPRGGLTWDGQQLVIVDDVSNNRIYTLARNNDGSYTPANVVDQGCILLAAFGHLRSDLGRAAACHRRQNPPLDIYGRWRGTMTGATRRPMQFTRACCQFSGGAVEGVYLGRSAACHR